MGSPYTATLVHKIIVGTSEKDPARVTVLVVIDPGDAGNHTTQTIKKVGRCVTELAVAIERIGKKHRTKETT